MSLSMREDRRFRNARDPASGSPVRLLVVVLACLLALTACLPPARPAATPTPAPGTPPSAPTLAGTPAGTVTHVPGSPSAAGTPSAATGTLVPGTPGTGTPAAAPPSPPVPPSPAPTLVPDQPPDPAAVNKRGVHLLIDDGNVRFPEAVWDEHATWAGRLSGPGGYAVELVRSNDLRPDSWQHLIDLLHRERQVPIIRLATFKDAQNQWWTAPVPDPDGRGYTSEADRFRRFFDAIDWPTDTVLVTVANETNRPDEWGGAPDPAAYARFLRDVSDALKRVTSVKVLVLNGALDAYAPSATFGTTFAIDSERYLEGMIAEVPDIFERLDGWASHAYPLGPFIEHPGRQVFKVDDVRPEARPRRQPPPGLNNRGVNGYEWELWKLQQLGVSRALPVYITETGWRHRATQDANARDKDFATVEDDRFADLVRLSFDGPPSGPAEGWTPWNHDPRVQAVVLFALAGRPDHWGHTNLLLVAPDGRIQGTYAFAEALTQVYPGIVARESGTPAPAR
jgi:hypothetical protein